MAEVRVHLDYDVGPAGGCVAEAVDVRPAQALLGLSVEDRDVGSFRRQCVGDLAGAVGRVVVDHEYVSIRHGAKDGLGDRPNVVLFVIRR